MQLRWAASAEADLERIAAYLSEHTPLHAERLVWTIYRAPEVLLRSPLIGREGRRPGTRELVLMPLPWILIYAVREETIDIVRVLHGAQRWP
jgi:toxin ParE1/3/4